MAFYAHGFLENLALVLFVAALATVVFQLIRQPLVVGYLVAGMIVGPHIKIPLYAQPREIHEIADLGMILLIFGIGLEFDLRRLLRLLPTCGVVTVVQVGAMIAAGYFAGRMLGFTPMEALFTGALVSISSTTIVAKLFAEEPVEGRLHELAFGVLLIEDLVAILELALLTAVASDVGLSARGFLLTAGRLAAFLAALVAVGMLLVPPLMRLVARLQRAETLVVAAVGVCFLFALLAKKAGYSTALGAFLAGSLMAESGKAKEIEHVATPVRDVFGAVFFVSVGMLIQPPLLIRYWPALAVLVGVVVIGKIVGVGTGSLMVGEPLPIALKAGFAMAQIGEFSFIIAELGVSTKVSREFLYSLAVAVSAVTAFGTPFLLQVCDPTIALVERLIPRRVQTLMLNYGAWIHRKRPAASLEKKEAAPKGA